jgi:hypothetical protein
MFLSFPGGPEDATGMKNSLEPRFEISTTVPSQDQMTAVEF